MKVMVMVKFTGADEAKYEPDPAMFEAMGKYNEELVKAGIMLDGQGLLPSAQGARIVFQGGDTSVVDGPFTESKELVGGFWIWQVSSMEEAIEWARRCPADPSNRGELEIRRIAEPEDFGEAYTPEQAEHDARLAEQIKQQGA